MYWIARPMFNEGPGVFREFKTGDALVASRHFMQGTDALLETLAQAWRFFNVDDRPNGREERSLSVGDVVQLVASDTKAVSYWSVESTGFKQRSRLAVVRALRQRGDGNATADDRPRGLTLAAALRVADSLVGPEDAVRVSQPA